MPRQRNTREENETIKDDRVPESWSGAGCANMLAQKDTDARWAKKNNEVHYGYKDHVLCDAESKMIVDFLVSAASVHDSQVLLSLLDTPHGKKVKRLWADSAYTGAELHEQISRQFPEIMLHIHEKGFKGSPLTEEQKAANREKSRIRARIEHVFGQMSGSMQGMQIRSIGRERACCEIGLKNLAYNLSRYATLLKLGRVTCMG